MNQKVMITTKGDDAVIQGNNIIITIKLTEVLKAPPIQSYDSKIDFQRARLPIAISG